MDPLLDEFDRIRDRLALEQYHLRQSINDPFAWRVLHTQHEEFYLLCWQNQNWRLLPDRICPRRQQLMNWIQEALLCDIQTK